MTKKQHLNASAAWLLHQQNDQTDSNEILHGTTRLCEGRDLVQDVRFQVQTNVCNLVKSPWKIAFVMETVVMQRLTWPWGNRQSWEAAWEALLCMRRTRGRSPSPEKGLKGKGMPGRDCRRRMEEGTAAAHKTHPALPGLQLKIHIFWTEILIF